MRIGILMIGSLLWDDGENNIRKYWRQERLESLGNLIRIRAPLRYGRAALTRGGTYTMVLSAKASLGSAVVIPCVKEVTSLEDLYDEAKCLWRAESNDFHSEKISSTWGCIAIKVRDQAVQSDEMFQRWSQFVAGNPDEFRIEHAKDESSLVSKDGFLEIAWPEKLDGTPLSEVDALLVTVNQPTLTTHGDYAVVQDIVLAWLKSPKYDNYFYKNREHGIKTFEDDAILDEFWRAHPGACGGPVF